MTFDFIADENYSASNFIVFSGNIEAFCLANRMRGDDSDLVGQIVFLGGDRKCGKTHLSQIWKQNRGAKTIDLLELYKLPFESFVEKIGSTVEQFEFYLIDDFPQDIEDDKFFYLVDVIANNNSTILIVSNFNRRREQIILRDLESRIVASTFLKIGKLTRDVKPMLINKLFSDRQIFIDGNVLEYLDRILITNYENIYNYIDKICSGMLEEEHRLTVGFIKKYFHSKSSE
jgi:chromosomal replication initiation ATPase DnaA